jgi:hypothetical protein
MSRRTLAGMLAFAIIALLAFSLYAQKWEKQGKFDGNEHFEYKIITNERGQTKELKYILDIKKAGDGFEVSYTTKGKVPKDKLGMQAAFGLVGLYGISLNAIVLNPMTTIYFQQLDLKEGEKMSFYGAGMVKVMGKETVGGQEGYVCEFYQTQGEGEKLISTTTVNPDLPLPIRSKMENSEVVLLKYSEN